MNLNHKICKLKGTNEKAATLVFFSIWIILTFSTCTSFRENVSPEENEIFKKALHNGVLANEGFIRSYNYMNAWLSYADPESKLVPRTLDRDTDIWNAQDCAADNYPFLVLTAYFTDQEKYHGIMKEMLANEIRLTSRVKSLPDTYSFSKKGFLEDSIFMDKIIFGTSEYMKDGLLPLMEWLGESPWSERMLTMLDDLNEYVDVAGGLDEKTLGKAAEAEVNGELLQVLSRVYWMTGEQKYLDWAIQIGDHFLLGEKYPLSSFNYLRMRDHGCELVAGLCELYVTLNFTDKKKKEAYQTPLYRLLDYILENGRNKDGFFYNGINPKTGETVDEGLADTWGYTLNGYVSVYMIDSIAAYKEAASQIFSKLDQYRNYDWENDGADGYADAVEGAINLYNRIPDERAANWIDSEIKVMWSMQDSSHRENAQKWKGSGIIEGWYGDGNFARTSMMYSLWKSKGTYFQPWTRDIRLGAEIKGDTLFMGIQSAIPWEGKIHFDKARHTGLNMPIDWPRINQFSEWYTVDPSRTYLMMDLKTGNASKVKGESLIKGYAMKLEEKETKRLMLILVD